MLRFLILQEIEDNCGMKNDIGSAIHSLMHFEHCFKTVVCNSLRD